MFHVSSQGPYIDDPIRKRSPLLPSNPNVCPRFSAFMTAKEASSITVERKSGASQIHKAHRKPEQLRNQRRYAFLNKVRQASDNKRWETRSDQILRQDFLVQQKEWLLEQATSAPPEPPNLEDDLDDPSKHQALEENDMVDYILSQEAEECQALMYLMNEANEAAETINLENEAENMSEFGSEAEDYERLFMDAACQLKQGAQDATLQDRDCSMPEAQEMDVSPD